LAFQNNAKEIFRKKPHEYAMPPYPEIIGRAPRWTHPERFAAQRNLPLAAGAEEIVLAMVGMGARMLIYSIQDLSFRPSEWQ
jgi:hypothetical protein